MDNRVKLNNSIFFSIFLFLLCCCSSFSVVYTLANDPTNTDSLTKTNPFTTKASLIRYWNTHISNNLPKSTFLLSKSSPLSTVESAFFAKLASQKALSSRLTAFCSAANLFCTSKPSILDSHKGDANFASYNNKQFANYGSARQGGLDQFKTYSDGNNFATGSFARYSRGSTGHHEGFNSYAQDGNVASSNFSSYAASATGGSGDFKNYMPRVNVPDLRFTSYDSDGNGHKLSFSSYSDDTNSGNQGFAQGYQIRRNPFVSRTSSIVLNRSTIAN